MSELPAHLATLKAKAIQILPELRCPGTSTDIETGVLCAWCGGSREMVRHEVFGCVACGHREHRPRTDGCEYADRGHCSRCNT